jgi:chromate transporter
MFLSYLRIGATGFGGPMALVSLLQQEFVERRKVVTSEEFAEGVAIGGILPGPIAIDAAVYIGYRLRGWLGALAAAGGLVLPPFLIVLIVTPIYFWMGRLPEFEGFLSGVRPAVVAVIAAAAWRLGKRSLAELPGLSIAAFVLVASLVCARVNDLAPGWGWLQHSAPTIKALSSVALILASGLLGLLVRPRPKPPAEPKEAKA